MECSYPDNVIKKDDRYSLVLIMYNNTDKEQKLANYIMDEYGL